MGVPPSNVTFVALDFESENLALALARHGHNSDQRSIFLWEGVTNYLTAAAVDATLSAVRRISVPGSLLLFTYVHQGVIDGSSSFPEARRWVAGVRRAGEPWTFGLHPIEVAEFLSRRGFRLADDVSTAEAGDRYFRPLGRGTSESWSTPVAVMMTNGEREPEQAGRRPSTEASVPLAGQIYAMGMYISVRSSFFAARLGSFRYTS